MLILWREAAPFRLTRKESRALYMEENWRTLATCGNLYPLYIRTSFVAPMTAEFSV